MTAPTYESTTVTDFSSDATSHLVSMPATVNAGDLLLAIASFDSSSTSITTPSGWSKRIGNNNDPITAIYAKIAAGTEGGTTVDFATSNNQRGSVHVIRVSAWAGTLDGLRSTINQTGSGLAMIGLSIGNVARDVLWVAAQAKSTATGWGGSPPPSYINENLTGSGENTSNSGSVASATRAATGVTSEEIYSMWNAGTSFWSMLIAVLSPVAASGGGPIVGSPIVRAA